MDVLEYAWVTSTLTSLLHPPLMSLQVFPLLPVLRVFLFLDLLPRFDGAHP